MGTLINRLGEINHTPIKNHWNYATSLVRLEMMTVEEVEQAMSKSGENFPKGHRFR